MIYLTSSSHQGEPDQPHTPKLKFQNMALEFVRQMQFNSMVETEFPVKIWARSNPFKGCFELNFQFMVASLHALPIHVFWAGYVFLNEYTTYFSFSGAHSRQNMVYSLTSALLVKIWANLKAPPRRRITGLLGPIYHTSNHCYTGCNSKSYAVRFSRLQTIF